MKRLFFLLFLSMFLLAGCSTDSNKKEENSNLYYKTTDSYHFGSFELLKSRINEDESNYHYYSLYPSLSVYYPYSYSLHIEKDTNGTIIENTISELFGIIDGKLKRPTTEEYMTTLGYDILFICKFYCTDDSLKDIHYEDDSSYDSEDGHIITSRLKITIIGEKTTIGYITALYGKIDAVEAVDYINDYIKENLIKL